MVLTIACTTLAMMVKNKSFKILILLLIKKEKVALKRINKRVNKEAVSNIE
jgi:hypothetical protein